MTENSSTVKKRDYVFINYVAKFEDETVFDITSKEKALEEYDKEKEYRPIFFRVDTGQVIKGIDKGVLEIAHPRICKVNLQYR